MELDDVDLPESIQYLAIAARSFGAVVVGTRRWLPRTHPIVCCTTDAWGDAVQMMEVPVSLHLDHGLDSEQVYDYMVQFLVALLPAARVIAIAPSAKWSAFEGITYPDWATMHVDHQLAASAAPLPDANAWVSMWLARLVSGRQLELIRPVEPRLERVLQYRPSDGDERH